MWSTRLEKFSFWAKSRKSRTRHQESYFFVCRGCCSLPLIQNLAVSFGTSTSISVTAHSVKLRIMRLLVSSTASGNRLPSNTTTSGIELGEAFPGLQSAGDTGNVTRAASGLGPVGSPTWSFPLVDRGGHAVPSELPVEVAGEV